MIHQVRQALQEQLQQYRSRGHCLHLDVVLDLMSLEGGDNFKPFEALVSVFSHQQLTS